MHLEAVFMGTGRCTWRPQASEFGDALGGPGRVEQRDALEDRDGVGSLIISNDPSWSQKHPGVPDGSDDSAGTSYPLTENYTLPVAHIPPLLYGDVNAPSERHVCYTLRRGCSYAEAVYTQPGDVYIFLRLPLLWECC